MINFKKIISSASAVIMTMSLLPIIPVVNAAEDEINMLLEANWDTVDPFDYSDDYYGDWSHNYIKQQNADVSSIKEGTNQYVKFSPNFKTANKSSIVQFTTGENKLTIPTEANPDALLWSDANYIAECDFYLPASFASEATEALPFNIVMPINGDSRNGSGIANMAIYGNGVSSDSVTVKPKHALWSYDSRFTYSHFNAKEITTGTWHNIKYVVDYDTMYADDYGATVNVYIDNEYFFSCEATDGYKDHSFFVKNKETYLTTVAIKGWTNNTNISDVYFDNARYYQMKGDFTIDEENYDSAKMELSVTANKIIGDIGTVKITEANDTSVEISNICKYEGDEVNIEIVDEDYKLYTDYVLTISGAEDIYGDSLASTETYPFNSGAGNPFLVVGNGVFNEASKTVTFNYSNILASDQAAVATITNSKSQVVAATVSHIGKALTISIPDIAPAERYSVSISGVNDTYGNILQAPSTLVFETRDKDNMILEANWDGVTAFDYSNTNYSGDWSHNYLKHSNVDVKSSTIDENQCVQFSSKGKTTGTTSVVQIMTGSKLLNNPTESNSNTLLMSDANYIGECDFYVPEDFASETTEAAPFNIVIGNKNFNGSGAANMGIYGNGESSAASVSIKPMHAKDSDDSKVTYSNFNAKEITTNNWHNIKYVVDYDTMYAYSTGATVDVYLDNEYFFTCTPITTSGSSFFVKNATTYLDFIPIKAWTNNTNISAVYLDNVKYYQSRHIFESEGTTFDTEKMQASISMNNIIGDLGTVKITEAGTTEEVASIASCSGTSATVEVTGTNYKLNTDYVLTISGAEDIYGDVLFDTLTYNFNSADGSDFLLDGAGVYNASANTVTFKYTNVLEDDQTITPTITNAFGDTLSATATTVGKELTIALPTLEGEEGYTVSVSGVKDIYGRVLSAPSVLTFTSAPVPVEYVYNFDGISEAIDICADVRVSADTYYDNTVRLTRNSTDNYYTLTPQANPSNKYAERFGFIRTNRILVDKTKNSIQEYQFRLPEGFSSTEANPLFLGMYYRMGNIASDYMRLGLKFYVNDGNAVLTPYSSIDNPANKPTFSFIDTTKAISKNEWHTAKYIIKYPATNEKTTVDLYIDGEYVTTFTNEIPYGGYNFEDDISSNEAVSYFTMDINASIDMKSIKLYQPAYAQGVRYLVDTENVESTLVFKNAILDSQRANIKDYIKIYNEDNVQFTDYTATFDALGKILTLSYDEQALGKDVYTLTIDETLLDVNYQSLLGFEQMLTMASSLKSKSVYVDSYVVTEAPSATGAKVTVNYRNVLENNREFWTCVAIYDQYNELIGTECGTYTFTPDEEEKQTMNFDITSNCAAADKMMIFVWDSIDTMKPLQVAELIELN